MYRPVAALVADLWAWQAGTHLSGRKRMSEDESRALPSFAFYGRLPAFRALRDQRVDDPGCTRCSRVCSLFEIIVRVMDGVERELNWDKPRVMGKEIGDDGWTPLQDGLEALTRAARSFDDEFAWQERIIAAFAAAYPRRWERGERGGERLAGDARRGASVVGRGRRLAVVTAIARRGGTR